MPTVFVQNGYRVSYLWTDGQMSANTTPAVEGAGFGSRSALNR